MVETAPPAEARRAPRGAWAWPFVVAVAFASGVALWLQAADAQDRDDQRQALIAASLTLQSRIGDALAAEQAAIRTLGSALPRHADATALLRQPAVAEGLRRMWVSVTLLDASHRIAAHVPHDSPQPVNLPAGGSSDSAGLTVHLSEPMSDGERLIVRLAPSTLLRQAVPWWLARQYDVRMVDGFGQLVAASGDALPPQTAPGAFAPLVHRVVLEPMLADTYLELTQRSPPRPWWRTLPVLLLAAFLLLSAAATWALRRRMLEVAQAESRWRMEAAWRRSIEDSLTVGLRGRDLDGRLTYVNPAFCDLVGLPAEALLGRLPPMPYWPRDEVEDSMARHRRNMTGGAPREGYEARWQRSDGRAIDVMIFEAPLVDATGRHVGWMGSIVDITARRQAEERERRQLARLANQARLTTLGEVASALAHQLNQPLAAIAGYQSGLQRALRDAPDLDPRAQEALQRLGEQAHEAARIVQRIRAFVTRRAPQPERCELPALVARVLALLRRDLQAAGCEVETAFAPALPEVQVDPVLIEQVVINLLRNALDEFALAAPRTGPPRLRVAAVPVGARFVRIDIDDNGPGLDARDIAQLAEPFHSTKPEGMGMGLAICRSVIEAHHGGMEAGASPLLGGARLSFTLPVDADEPAEPADDRALETVGQEAAR